MLKEQVAKAHLMVAAVLVPFRQVRFVPVAKESWVPVVEVVVVLPRAVAFHPFC